MALHGVAVVGVDGAELQAREGLEPAVALAREVRTRPAQSLECSVPITAYPAGLSVEEGESGVVRDGLGGELLKPLINQAESAF